MKLRWHRYRNEVTTADYHNYLRAGGELSMSGWLREARRETAWILQYFDESVGAWVDIPQVSEPHPAR